MSVPDNEKAISGNDDVFGVAFDVSDGGGLLGGAGALAEMGMCAPKEGTFLLGCLPRCATGKGHSDGASENVSDGGSMDDRVLHLGNETADLATGVKALRRVSAGEVGGKVFDASDMTYVN